MNSKVQLDVRYLGRGGAIWWMVMGWRPCVAGWGGGVFASCLVRCTAPSVAFVNQLPLLRLYSAPGHGFLRKESTGWKDLSQKWPVTYWVKH